MNKQRIRPVQVPVHTPVEFDEKRIDRIFARFDQCHLPGAAVGIAIDGNPVYRKGFGLANMELPIVLSPTIRMRVGSISKQFAALAYLLLCEERKAGLYDQIGKYLPELHSVTHKVTMRQLMSHLGGLRDAYEIGLLFSGMGRSVSSDELLSLYRDIDDTNSAPGTEWNYNNGAYLMLSVAIERITGRPLEEILKDRIFGPIGMYETILRRFDTDFASNSAALHMTNSKGEFEKSYFGADFVGAGGVVSTVDDMLRWLAHMDSPTVGTSSTWKMMKASHTLTNGTSTGYGLGLITAQYYGMETISHAGGWMGGNAQMIKVMEAALDAVVIVNRQDASAIQLVKEVLNACLPRTEPSKLSGSPPLAATGTFQSPKTGRVIQLTVSGGQQFVTIDGYNWPFVHEEAGVLRPVQLSNYRRQTLTLHGDPERPTSITFSDFGNVDEMVTIGPATAHDRSRVAGRYKSAATGTEAVISNADGHPRLVTMGRFGSATYDLEGIADCVWRAKPLKEVLGGILLFQGDYSGFSFSSVSTKALIFRRC